MALSLPDQPPMEITGWPDSRMTEDAVWSVATATSQVAPSWCFFRYVIIAELTSWLPPMPPAVRPDGDCLPLSPLLALLAPGVPEPVPVGGSPVERPSPGADLTPPGPPPIPPAVLGPAVGL